MLTGHEAIKGLPSLDPIRARTPNATNRRSDSSPAPRGLQPSTIPTTPLSYNVRCVIRVTTFSISRLFRRPELSAKLAPN
jgi:hypothetical protein